MNTQLLTWQINPVAFCKKLFLIILEQYALKDYNLEMKYSVLAEAATGGVL